MSARPSGGVDGHNQNPQGLDDPSHSKDDFLNTAQNKKSCVNHQLTTSVPEPRTTPYPTGKELDFYWGGLGFNPYLPYYIFLHVYMRAFFPLRWAFLPGCVGLFSHLGGLPFRMCWAFFPLRWASFSGVAGSKKKKNKTKN